MSRNFRKEWKRGENGVMFTDQESVEWIEDLLDELDKKKKDIEYLQGSIRALMDDDDDEHEWIEIVNKKDKEEIESISITLTDEQLEHVIEESKKLDHKAILERLPRAKKKVEEIQKDRECD